MRFGELNFGRAIFFWRGGGGGGGGVRGLLSEFYGICVAENLKIMVRLY